MAQVAHSTQRQIDRLLARSFDEWQELPEVEGAIDGWEQIDQIVYVEEWTLAEERLIRLERYADDGLLTPEQTARHNDLKRLVAQNRPIIERLRAS
jgi:hypothetical protein